MIRKTLPQTKKATFMVTIADPSRNGFPAPTGTGFFITPTGYFLTANHVVEAMQIGDKTYIERPTKGFSEGVADVELIEQWPDLDIALMKADLEQNSRRDWLKNLKGFPYIEVELEEQEEGLPVYSFGYPLTTHKVYESSANMQFGLTNYSVRATSAIVASSREYHGPVQSSSDPQFYAIDKALNYGNSGGPIVVQETGKVFALCTRFQPVSIRQVEGNDVFIPSLYSIVSSINNIEERINSLEHLG